MTTRAAPDRARPLRPPPMSQPRLRTWLDGVPAEGPLFGAHDAAVLLGDGVMESVRVHRGGALALDLHLERLRGAVEHAGMAAIDAGWLAEAVASPLGAAAELVDGALRLFCWELDGRMRLLATLEDWAPPSEEAYAAGVRVVPSEVVHPAHGAFGKTTSRHWSRAAARLAQRAGFDDALLLDREGRAIETTTATLLWRDADGWSAVPDELGGLHSTTLALLERSGLRVRRRPAGLDTLVRADAIVLLSALRLAIGVRCLGAFDDPEPDRHAAPLRATLLA